MNAEYYAGWSEERKERHRQQHREYMRSLRGKEITRRANAKKAEMVRSLAEDMPKNHYCQHCGRLITHKGSPYTACNWQHYRAAFKCYQPTIIEYDPYRMVKRHRR